MYLIHVLEALQYHFYHMEYSDNNTEKFNQPKHSEINNFDKKNKYLSCLHKKRSQK